MTSACQVVSIEPVLLAVAEAELDRREVAVNIRRMFDVVYSWLKGAPVEQVGHNHALYDKGVSRELHRTYAELHAWCRREGLRIGSQSWEVYGDWQADASRLETELYLRLA